MSRLSRIRVDPIVVVSFINGKLNPGRSGNRVMTTESFSICTLDLRLFSILPYLLLLRRNRVRRCR